jgi:ribonuclease-3
MNDKVSYIAERVGHRFVDPNLLDTALTHRSAARQNNERLEFLGDAVLNFVIAEILYTRLPKSLEGELTRLRASLVNRQTLAELARELQMGCHLKLGGGELKTGGRTRDSILADAFEAVVGAIYLDGGLASCRECVEKLFAQQLRSVWGGQSEKDPKTRLQELLQARKLPLPIYTVSDVSGGAHSPLFTVACHVGALTETPMGRGTTRRKAEQEAARKTLELIGHD